MSFPNVSKGLKPVLASEILSLLGIAAYSVFSTMTGVGDVAKIIVAIVAVILLLAALIFCIRGLKLASTEERHFKSAYEINIAMVVIEILYIIFGLLKTKVPFFAKFTRSATITTVFETCAYLSIVLGIKSCFARQGDDRAKRFANTVFVFGIISGVIEIISSIIGASVSGVIETATGTPALVIGIAAIALVVFTLIEYILYIVLLAKGIRKFA